MKNLLQFRFDKKIKYLIQTILVVIFIYLFAVGGLRVSFSLLAVLVVVIVVAGSLLTHFPNIKPINFLISIIMPLNVIAGALLSLWSYPNLGYAFKLIFILGFGFIYYLVSLMDNVFLVIQDREEVIPLYRVAIAWSLILQVVVAIPIFAGVFKLSYDALYQALIVGIVSIIFSLYQLWILQFDADAKDPKVGEGIFLLGSIFFFTTIASIMTSFIPTESFLRALFEASVLMFSLVYLSGHLKNEISKKLMLQYGVYIIIFTILLLTFTP